MEAERPEPKTIGEPFAMDFGVTFQAVDPSFSLEDYVARSINGIPASAFISRMPIQSIGGYPAVQFLYRGPVDADSTYRAVIIAKEPNLYDISIFPVNRMDNEIVERVLNSIRFK